MERKCLLIKKKEYDDLKSRAESNVPEIRVKIYGSFHSSSGDRPCIMASVDLSKSLLHQLNRLVLIARDRLTVSAIEYILEMRYVYGLTKREAKLMDGVCEKIKTTSRCF